MTRDQVVGLLQAKGVTDSNVINQEADALTRYADESEIVRLNGPDWFRRYLTRQDRPTLSNGGTGGDLDVDEDGGLDPGWVASIDASGGVKVQYTGNAALAGSLPSQNLSALGGALPSVAIPVATTPGQIAAVNQAVDAYTQAVAATLSTYIAQGSLAGIDQVLQIPPTAASGMPALLAQARAAKAQLQSVAASQSTVTAAPAIDVGGGASITYDYGTGARAAGAVTAAANVSGGAPAASVTTGFVTATNAQGGASLTTDGGGFNGWVLIALGVLVYKFVLHRG